MSLCECRDSWDYPKEGTQHSGCSTSADSPGKNWCYIKEGQDGCTDRCGQAPTDSIGLDPVRQWVYCGESYTCPAGVTPIEPAAPAPQASEAQPAQPAVPPALDSVGNAERPRERSRDRHRGADRSQSPHRHHSRRHHRSRREEGAALPEDGGASSTTKKHESWV